MFGWAGKPIHLDIKKLARIERVGHRIRGDRSKPVDGAGWEYVHVCIDDASRVSYAEVLPNERGVTCAAFLERSAERTAALSDFLCHYSCHRRHWGIGRCTPQLRLSQIVNMSDAQSGRREAARHSSAAASASQAGGLSEDFR